MHYISPFDGFGQFGFVGFGKCHTLRFDEAVEQRQVKFAHNVFVVALGTSGYHAHLVAVVAQHIRKTLGRYGSAVVVGIKLVDN